jgi:hypothetical protein
VLEWASRLKKIDAQLIVVGDRKGPKSFQVEGVEFLSLSAQRNSPFELARILPEGHYARKNIGYLSAISRRANCIYETDDDNVPLPEWSFREKTAQAVMATEKGWVNVYRFFSEERIWPRGLPLDEVENSCLHSPRVTERPKAVKAPIQQGLVNNSPDVDAIWHLLYGHRFDFQNNPSVYLPKGSWCPFNSQSTWWWPVAYPLLYLPSYCSFRMTDIWRSFVAQRCLWELGSGVVFHAPEVEQERNVHDLMRDFEDEIPGYLSNRKIATLLEKLHLERGEEAVGQNLLLGYDALVEAGFFPNTELELVRAWLSDLSASRR